MLEVLGRDGYAGLTMDAVALVAGVGKATIYRRWSSKTDLLLGVMAAVRDEASTVPDTGCLRDDLVAVLTATVDLLTGPAGRAVRGLLGAVLEDPVLAEAYQRGPLAWWNAAWATALDRAAARGEISAAARASLAAEAGPAVVGLRWLVTGGPLDAAVVSEIVDMVTMPLLTRPQTTPAGPGT
ncbi:transcriptional regulator, TetR family [Geodermatophilus ruber]|uniref:Transcriptional regulator, TetR family n=1 Tax=Geodermatophilus ruber TaxID=504800 RepID=A0A1I4DVW8_9ACTN|nr:transcriptional regulator, TetR family [Geodermatophilus ruber]